MSRKRIGAAFLPLVLVTYCFSAVIPAQADEIILAADSWCPYNCDPKDANQGFIVDIAKAVFTEAGHTVTYKLSNWSRSISEAKEGKLTGVIGAAPADAEDFIFPEEEQAIQSMCFFVKSDSTWTFKDVESLKSVKLGAVKDYSYDTAIDAYIEGNPTAINLFSGDDSIEKISKMLVAGRIGAYIDDRQVVSTALQKLGQTETLKEAGCLPADKIFIAFSPSNAKSKDYAQLLSSGMGKLRTSGKLKEILAKYNLNDWK